MSKYEPPLTPEAMPAIPGKPNSTTEGLENTDEKTQEANHEKILPQAASTTTEGGDGGASADDRYPKSWQLIFIIFALSVSVLCMALVSVL